MLSQHLPKLSTPKKLTGPGLEAYLGELADAVRGLQFLVSLLYLHADAAQRCFAELGVEMPGPVGEEIARNVRTYTNEVQRRLGALEEAASAPAPAKRRARTTKKKAKAKKKAAPRRRK
jgi:hypothetical protein